MRQVAAKSKHKANVAVESVLSCTVTKRRGLSDEDPLRYKLRQELTLVGGDITLRWRRRC